VNFESANEDELISKSVGKAAGVGCMAWRVLVAVIGGAGLLLSNSGSTETQDAFGNSDIHVNRRAQSAPRGSVLLLQSSSEED